MMRDLMHLFSFRQVVNPDGAVTFRVYGEKAAGLMRVAPDTADGAREWQDEIAKLKTAKTKTKGR